MHPFEDNKFGGDALTACPPNPKAEQDEATEKVASSFPSVGQTLGLGMDIVEASFVEGILADCDRTNALFTAEEQKYCRAFALPSLRFAACLAAKEACLKALELDGSQGFDAADVEVRRNQEGGLHLRLSQRLLEEATRRGVVEMPVSLSHTATDGIAIVLALTERSIQARKKRIDPTSELSRRFKELRGMLDEGFPEEASRQDGRAAR